MLVEVLEMSRFFEGCDRRQKLLLPDCVDDYVAEDSPVRVVDPVVDELDLMALGLRRGGDGAPTLSSGDDAQALHLRLL